MSARRSQFSAMVAAVCVLGVGACTNATSLPVPHSPAPASSASTEPTGSDSPTRLPGGVVARIAFDGRYGPTGMAAADGSVWVQSHRDTALSRIDPATNQVSGTVDVGQESCGQPLAAYGQLWLQPCGTSTSTIVVDAKTTTVRGRVHDAGGTVMAAAAGSVWVAKYELDAIKRVDPATDKIVATIPVATGLIAAGDGAIWSAGVTVDDGDSDGHLSKIDPATNRIVARYRVPKLDHVLMTFAYGALWMMPGDQDALIRIDPATGKVSTSHLAGWEPLTEFTETPVIAAANSLWIRLSDSTVGRIDPTTRQVSERFPADDAGGGGYPLVAFGSLWVANFDTDTVWRDRLT